METQTVQMTDLARAEQRLPRWMMGCALLGLLGALLMGQGRFCLAFALGAALAILSYLWLHQAIDALMTSGQPRVTKSVVAKFALRYPLAFAAVFVFYKTGWLPFLAVLAGFFVPVAGVLVEAIVQLVEGCK